MTDPIAPAAPRPASSAPAITTDEAQSLHADDRRAARRVLGLLEGILLLGLLMYLALDFWIAD